MLVGYTVISGCSELGNNCLGHGVRQLPPSLTSGEVAHEF